MSFYESLSCDELAELHRETFDGMYKDTYFEIIDDNGVVKGGFKTFDQAEYALGKLKEDNYKFKGDVKIVEVRYVSLKKYSAMIIKDTEGYRVQVLDSDTKYVVESYNNKLFQTENAAKRFLETKIELKYNIVEYHEIDLTK